MNAPSPMPAPTGTTEELRQFIAENLALAIVHVEHGIDYAKIGSDVALGYALRAASAYIMAASETYGDLEIKEAAHAR